MTCQVLKDAEESLAEMGPIGPDHRKLLVNPQSRQLNVAVVLGHKGLAVACYTAKVN